MASIVFRDHTAFEGEVMNKKIMMLALVLFAAPAFATDHRDSPSVTDDPIADITDFYAFMKNMTPVDEKEDV